MNAKWPVLVLMLGFFTCIPLALAHHSINAAFDPNHTVTLKGTVTEVSWGNPHVRLYMDTKDASGEVMMWELEMGSPNLMFLNGWKIDTLKPGTQVVVDAYPARNGSNLGYAKKVTRTAQ